MNYCTHNFGDYAIKTRFMTFEQKGIYIDLRDTYLSTGKPLASEWVANMERMASEGSVEFVLKSCFELRDGAWVSDELDQILADYAQKVEKNRENASKPRKARLQTIEPIADGDPPASESLTNRLPLANESLTTNNQKPITNNNLLLTKVSNCPSSSKLPDCPYEEIGQLFNGICGQYLPRVMDCKGATRRRAINARWKELADYSDPQTKENILSKFQDIFEIATDSDFLMGKSTKFKATFDWLMQSDNWKKVAEGNYRNGTRH